MGNRTIVKVFFRFNDVYKAFIKLVITAGGLTSRCKTKEHRADHPIAAGFHCKVVIQKVVFAGLLGSINQYCY